MATPSAPGPAPVTSWSGVPVVVTGGLGFIGSNLARVLASAGAPVTVIDGALPGSGAHAANLDGVPCRVLRASLAASGWEEALRGARVVFHLAGHTSHVDSMREPLKDLDLNARSTLNLLEACRHNAPGAIVVYASTRQVYGKVERLPVKADHAVDPPDINAVHKLAGEHYLSLYQRVHGLRGVVLRLTNVYGPRMRIADAKQMFLGVWIRRLLEGQPFEVWGGAQKRDLLHVDDAVSSFLAAAQTRSAWGRTFNIGRTEPVTLRQLADELVAANGAGRYTVREMPAERAAIEIGDYASDPTAFEQATGWRAQVPLAQGLRQTLEFFRSRLAPYLEAVA